MISPMSINNNISSLIRNKQNNGNSRLAKLAMHVSLEPSREELIKIKSDQLSLAFAKSKENNFHDNYFYYDDEKLGEGAHACVYKCYLIKDRDKVEAYR